MSRGLTARLFVAVDPSEGVRDELLAWGRAAAARLAPGPARGTAAPLRLLEPDALHVTLCFLGTRPVGEIDSIGSALSSSARYVGELSVGAPLWLPPRRPQALAVEVQDRGGGLAKLHAALRGALSAATGWEAERRRFKAHITVARMRRRAARRRPAQGGETLLPATPRLSFTPSSVVLYRSRLSPAGATYEALATCDLPAYE